jgi:RNA polymerase sigma-70 factor (ECF subfamily)
LGTPRGVAASNVVKSTETREKKAMQPATAPTISMDMSDADLARLIAAGDLKVFAALMRRHNQTLYRTARSILKDDAEAEDAVQEAWLLAYHAMNTFRGEARLSTWLVRIVMNEALGRRRKQNRRAEVIWLSGDREGEPQAPGIDDMDDATHDQPERAAQRADTRRLIEASVDRLPEAFRTVFVLRAVEELTVEETSSCLGIPPATVRTRYFRARALLREAMSHELDLCIDGVFGFAGERCDRIVAAVLARLSQPKQS